MKYTVMQDSYVNDAFVKAGTIVELDEKTVKVGPDGDTHLQPYVEPTPTKAPTAKPKSAKLTE